MTYNFDEEIDRTGTGALKTDVLEERYGRADLLPLWVADMDFATPPFVLDALRERLRHPILGYTTVPAGYWHTVAQWIESHHGWTVEEKWLTFIPGVVKGIGLAVNFFLQPGDKVIIQPPVYHPFRITPEGNGHELVVNPLREEADGRFSMDFDNLERVADEKCRMLILCNPHNPGGRVWDAETLRRLAAFCHKRGIVVLSDEIHCDLALWGNRHTPFASVSPEAAACSITFGAPSKTFNIAGVVSSYAVVPNAELREPFYAWLEANEQNDPPLFAPIATLAAFTKGEEWRQQMLRYVEENILFTERFLAEKVPGVKAVRPEASFLVWLDCHGLGLAHDALIDLFVDRARLALNDGEMFGKGGEGFMRLNVGTPRSVLEKALNRLAEAVKGLA